MPKISIIIPIYNDSDYLTECLESITNQTLVDIEIVCVDDGSTDTSSEILGSFAGRDDRFNIIRFEENCGASQARKTGIQHSTGKYIMFVDGDDTLCTYSACEELYELIEKESVDIVQFGTDIINWGNLPDSRIISNEKLLEPLEKKIGGSSVFEECFVECKYSFNLWNKIYNGKLCRKAANEIMDGYYPKAQDMYLYFIISFFADSYLGVRNKYYRYRFGSGISGHNILNYEQFEKYILMGKVADELDRFLDQYDEDARYERVRRSYRDRLACDMVSNWFRLKEADKSVAVKEMFDKWDYKDVITAFEKQGKEEIGCVASSFMTANIKKTCKKAEVIGTFYPRAYGGGAQKVMVALANLWSSMGYKVVMITEEICKEQEYCIDPKIERCVLPNYIRGDYYERAVKLEEIIKEYQIDTIVYHAWVYEPAFWDLLVCSMSNLRIIMHTHNVFAIGMGNLNTTITDMVRWYKLADTVVTLNDVDTAFWKLFNSNVIQTKNPIDSGEDQTLGIRAKEKIIIWVGRFSEEKRPMDAISVFELIRKKIKDSKLYMLGEISEADRIFYEFEIKRRKLEEHIHIFGFRSDISDFYKKGTLLISTSEYEGFHLGIHEALSYGIPCVMYKLPYLTSLKSCRAVIQVEKKCDVMAQTVCELLEDENKLEELSGEAVRFTWSVTQYDRRKQWESIFSMKNSEGIESDVLEEMMLTLLDFYKRGVISKKSDMIRISIPSFLDRKLAFWGAGRNTRIILRKYPELPVRVLIDNNAEKAGLCVNGINVVNSNQITDFKEYFIIITPSKYSDISNQLELKGLVYGTDFVRAHDVLEFDTEIQEIDIEEQTK